MNQGRNLPAKWLKVWRLDSLVYFSLRGRETFDWFFQVWCLILLVVGLLGVPIAKWFVSMTKEKS
jgi:maltodextrin utilization protein YvdJ